MKNATPREMNPQEKNVSDGENTIDGYHLLNCIASGNSSEIWEISDGSGGSQPLCMKLLTPNAIQDANAKATLKHEAKVGKSLDHPSIIKIHRVSVTRQHGYILMDYFRAPNVKQLVSSDRVGLHSGFRKVFEGICLALGYMHEKGWVHKDIKPENILANRVGEMRLIDFSLSVRVSGGLAKLLGARGKTVQGTRTYIAPETLLKKAPTIQTDMYSLGITVFEMLTGNPPFRGMSPGDLLRMHVQEKAPPVSAVNPNVTPEMDRLVARLLEKKPAKRHASMEEVYSEFRSLKVFKEDPRELEAQRQAKLKEEELSALGASERINSRRDHQRSEAGLTEPVKKAEPKPTPKPASAPKPQATPARQPQPGGPPQQPQPGQPAMGPGQGYGYPPGMQPPPGYPMPPQMPGQYPPGMQPPPGYPMPPQMPGGYPPGYGPGPQQQPPQQQPGAPPQQPPPQQRPPQPQPPGQPPASQPPAPQGGQPQPPGQQPAQPKKPEHPPTTKREEDEDLPEMDMDDLDVL